MNHFSLITQESNQSISKIIIVNTSYFKQHCCIILCKVGQHSSNTENFLFLLLSNKTKLVWFGLVLKLSESNCGLLNNFWLCRKHIKISQMFYDFWHAPRCTIHRQSRHFLDWQWSWVDLISLILTLRFYSLFK